MAFKRQKRKYSSQKIKNDFSNIRTSMNEVDTWAKNAVTEEKGVKKEKRDYKLWSPEQVDFLRKNYNILPINKIAKKLGRTVPSIHAKARLEQLLPSQQDLKRSSLQKREQASNIPESKKSLTNYVLATKDSIINDVEKAKQSASTRLALAWTILTGTVVSVILSAVSLYLLIIK